MAKKSFQLNKKDLAWIDTQVPPPSHVARVRPADLNRSFRVSTRVPHKLRAKKSDKRRQDVSAQFRKAAWDENGAPVPIPVKRVPLASLNPRIFQPSHRFQLRVRVTKSDSVLAVTRRCAAVRKILIAAGKSVPVRFLMPRSQEDPGLIHLTHPERVSIHLRRSRRDGFYYIKKFTMG